jgi:hypothetical protein
MYRAATSTTVTNNTSRVEKQDRSATTQSTPDLGRIPSEVKKQVVDLALQHSDRSTRHIAPIFYGKLSGCLPTKKVTSTNQRQDQTLPSFDDEHCELAE